MNLRHPRVWFGLGLFWALFILVGCLVPSQPSAGVVGFDKLLHCAAFAGLALWFGAVYERSRALVIALGLIAFGGLIELLQMLTGYRSAEWIDWLADTTGVALGLGLAWTPLGGAFAWFETRVLARGS